VTREFEPSFFHAVDAIGELPNQGAAVVGSDSVAATCSRPSCASAGRHPGAMTRSLWEALQVILRMLAVTVARHKGTGIDEGPVVMPMLLVALGGVFEFRGFSINRN